MATLYSSLHNDTFLGKKRQHTSPTRIIESAAAHCGKIPPENIREENQLIRNEKYRHPRPDTPSTIHRVIRNLYLKAGLIQRVSNPNNKSGRRYELRAHSIRK